MSASSTIAPPARGEIKVFNLLEDKWTGRGDYIGRPSALGNPYKIGTDGAREQVIEKFRHWLWEIIKGAQAGAALGKTEREAWDELNRLKEKSRRGDLNLLCYCKPLPCHGDVIKSCIEWLREEAD